MEHPNRSATVLRGIGWLGTSSLMQATVRVVLMVILARLLAPEAYGLIALATAVVALTEIICRLGLESALIQRPSLTDDTLSAAASLILLSALTGMALLLVLAGPVAYFLGGGDELASVIRLMSLTLPVGAFTMVPRAVLSRDAQFRFLGATELLSYGLSSFAVAVPLAHAGWGVWALAFAAVTQPVVTMILLGRRETPFRGWQLDFAKITDLFAFGLPLTGAKLANFVALQADNVVVGRFLGVAALGAYTRAYALNTLPASMLAQAVDRSLFPVMSNAQEDRGALQRAMMRGLVALLVIFPPLSAFCFVYAEDIIAMLLGPQWGQTVLPFQILSLSMYFRVAYKLPDIVLRSVGRTTQILRLHVVYALMVVAGALVGVNFGLTGVAFGVGAAILLQYVQAMVQARDVAGLKLAEMLWWHAIAFSVGAFSCATFYGASLYLSAMAPLSFKYATVFLGLLLLIFIYGAMMIIVGLVFGEHGLWWRKHIYGGLTNYLLLARTAEKHHESL